MKRAPTQWRALSPRLRQQAALAGWGPVPEFLQRIVAVEPDAALPIERALAKLIDGQTDIPAAVRGSFTVIDGDAP